MKMFNPGTSKPDASMKENASENGSGAMAIACCEELVELDDVQLATVVGGFLWDLNNSQYTGPVQFGGRSREDEQWWALYRRLVFENSGRRV